MIEKTSLYRFFSEDDLLLYVGIAGNPFQRAQQHWQDKPMDQVRHIEVEWFETREDALAAEKVAIRRERPAWNIVAVRKPRNVRQTPKAEIKKEKAKVARKVKEIIETAIKPAAEPAEDRVYLHQFIGPLQPNGHALAIAPFGVYVREIDPLYTIRPFDPPNGTALVKKLLRDGDTLWISDEIPEKQELYRWALDHRIFATDEVTILDKPYVGD